jgi:hypothetical protein
VTAKKPNCDLDNALQRRWRQQANLALDEVLARSEELRWTRVAGELERTAGEVGLRQLDGPGIAIGIARDLTENVITAPGDSQDDGRTQL